MHISIQLEVGNEAAFVQVLVHAAAKEWWTIRRMQIMMTVVCVNAQGMSLTSSYPAHRIAAIAASLAAVCVSCFA